MVANSSSAGRAATVTSSSQHGTRAAVDGGGETSALLARIRQLELEVSTQREGMRTRQQIGFTTGVLAQRYGLQQDQAWKLLVLTSQQLNVKVRCVSDVLTDVYNGQLAPLDAPLAVRLNALLPGLCTGVEATPG